MRTIWAGFTLLALAAAAVLFLDRDDSVSPVEGDAPSTAAPVADSESEPDAPSVGPQIPQATIEPGKIVRRDDGSILADGVWEILGSGTRDDPYEVSWELLISASDSYIPRLGERKLPERIAILDGAWVRISGYIAFPLIATESEELLLMLNQWDGCCIGVPPTPYDAVEVRLRSAIEVGARHSFRYGSLTGILQVEPYIVEKWLVGLYVMEQASLRSEL